MINAIVKLFLIYFLVHECATLKEGDACQLEDGSSGTCTLITRCDSAKKAQAQGVLPTACDFIGTVIVACCKEKFVPLGRSAPRRPGFPPPPPPPMIPKSYFGSQTPRREAGLISKEKCKEYSQYAREKRRTDSLSLIPMYSDVLECPFDTNPLIVGGTLAALKEFPHMALIGYQPDPNEQISWNCGGSLISHNFVLTAAHCFYRPPFGSPKFVRVGITNQTDVTYMQQLEVLQLIYYPEYNGRKYHDLGLLKLASTVKMNPYARAACLYTEKVLPQSLVIASGWGVTNETANPSNNLLKVNLELFSQDTCNSMYNSTAVEVGSDLERGIVEDWMICAGSTTEIKDTCRGDSGGPLQVPRPDTKDVKCMYNIIGVTSFGKACGLAKHQPGVYTRVSHYIRWIEDEVWPEQ